MSHQKSTPNFTRAFSVVTTLFFMWGFITVLVDSLIPRLKEIFELSYFEAGLVQFAFFIAYGIVSIPAGALLSYIGYKRGMLIGLATMGVGCLLFWPAASLRIWPLFLIGYFVLAGGMTILQVAANPYVSVLGPERGASSRLNLSQAFNSLGTAIAPLIGAMFILSDNIKSSVEIDSLTEVDKLAYYSAEANAVEGPFIVLAISLLALAVFIALAKLPTVLGEKNVGTYREVLSNKRLTLGAIAIFLYVGAEVAIGSYLVNYFLDMNMAVAIRNSDTARGLCQFLLGNDLSVVDQKGIVGAFVMFYWTGAMVGRFIGAFLTKVYRPARVLSLFGVGAVLMILISMTTVGFVSMWSILAVGLFNSIMFPTIFTLAIEDLGDMKPKGSGILCTAICGGAFIPPLYGFFTDLGGFKVAFILVILCYGYIVYYSRTAYKQATMKTG
ncbi:MAG: sugar MFS transporter [Cyclobacteriaceae bacterium]